MSALAAAGETNSTTLVTFHSSRQEKDPGRGPF
jgi:hypothetical protein